jgi:tetratricopeptide (TPR) repeat protein
LLEQGRLQEAEQQLQAALQRQERIIAECGSSILREHDLGVILTSLGNVLSIMGRTQQAEQSLQRAVEILARLQAGSPDSYEIARDRARGLYYLALTQARTSRPAAAEAPATEAIALIESLQEEYPNYAELRYDLALARSSLGCAQAESGRHAEAEATLRQAVELRHTLLQESPGTHRFRSGLALTYNFLAQVLRRTGRDLEAGATYEKAHDIDPANPLVQNDFAWYLVTGPEAGPEALRRAIQLSEQSVQKVPEEGGFWNTLGVVRFRAGQLATAREAFQKSMELRGGGDGYDWYYLALIADREGNFQEARTWLDRAERWYEGTGEADRDMARLRGEALSALSVRIASGAVAGPLASRQPAAPPAVPSS